MFDQNYQEIVTTNDFNKLRDSFLSGNDAQFKNQKEQKDDREQFIHSLRSVAPHIHNLKNQKLVIACSGELFNCKERLHKLTHDIALLNAIGIEIVLIHGIDPQFEKQLHLHKIVSEFIQDVRVADRKAIEVAKEATGKVRLDIEAAFSQSLPNTPMANSSLSVASGNFVVARPLGVIDGVDYQYTGVVSKVDKESIIYLIKNQKIVLISPIGFSITGEAFNLSIEDLASSIAIAIHADKLIHIDKTIDLTAKIKKISKQMYVDEAEQLLTNKKTQNYLKMAISSCRNGVKSVHFVPHDMDGALLLELLKENHSGITIKANTLEDLREADTNDIENIIKLIEPLEKNGTLVKRDRNQLEQDIFNFSVIERNKILLGCAALFPYIEEQVGEMACLTVFPEAQGTGNGEKLLRQIEKRAKKLGLKKIFVLTVRTEHWFLKRGFVKTSVNYLPDDRRKLYNWQRRSLVLIKNL